MRQCVGCGERKPKKELLRIVVTSDGEAAADPTGRVNGRGAYICPKQECLRIAIRRKALERALGTEISEAAYDAIMKELED